MVKEEYNCGVCEQTGEGMRTILEKRALFDKEVEVCIENLPNDPIGALIYVIEDMYNTIGSCRTTNVLVLLRCLYHFWMYRSLDLHTQGYNNLLDRAIEDHGKKPLREYRNGT